MKNIKTTVLKNSLLIAVFTLISIASVKAQSPAVNTRTYTTAIGLRAGYTSGLTFKHFINDRNSINVIVGTWANAFSITGLYVWNRNTSVEGLNWYYGAGAHATVYRSNFFYRREGTNGRVYRYHRHSTDGVGVGADGILGLEYVVKSLPFAFSLDVKPSMEFSSNKVLYTAIDPALGVKFTF